MNLDMRAVIERLVMVVDVRIPSGLVNNVPEWFVERRQRDRAKWRRAIGCEVATLAEARRDFWPRIDAYHYLAGSMLAMLTPDGRIGLVAHQINAVPPGESEQAIVEEMLLAVISGKQGKAPEGMANLPRTLHDVLTHDGLSPEGFRAIGACINDIDIRVGGLRRRAKIGMKWSDHVKAVEQGLVINGEPLSIDMLTWRDEDVQLSRHPSVRINNGRISTDIELPHAFLQALPGRAATDVIDHPALIDRTIIKAVPRKRGFTLHLNEDTHP